MKITVTIPEDIFKATARLAKRRKVTRSKILRMALEDYLSEHCAHPVTLATNRFLAKNPQLEEPDPVLRELARRTMLRVEWED